MPNLSQESLRLLQEWRERQQILRSLDSWARLNLFEPARHHSFLNKELEAVERGDLKRLAIFMPPGSAKSTYSSVLFPPHFLAQKAGKSILACSHSTDLAESFGRRARNIIEAKSLQLGYDLAEHSKAAGRWETTNGGQYLAAGVGVGIAGYRADCGLIDDPIRNKEDADSKLIQDKHWDWYNYDFKPRLKPNASVVLIQTRWNENDLGGKILASAEGKDWLVIRIPFYAEDNDPLGRAKGEMLWPEWFLPSMFPTDSRLANALYQNNPTPEEGNFFKEDWIVEYRPEQLPKYLKMYCASDHAVSLKQEADPTLLVAFGLDEGENIWILPDFFWEHANTGVVVDRMIKMAKTHKPLTWFAGKEHITASIGPFLNKKMVETATYFYLKESSSGKDKPTKCQAIRGRMAQRKVFFPGYHPRWHEVKHEIKAFPAGAHDEWPDVLGEIGRGLEALVGGTPPPPEDREFKQEDTLFRPTMTWLKEMAERHNRKNNIRYGDR